MTTLRRTFCTAAGSRFTVKTPPGPESAKVPFFSITTDAAYRVRYAASAAFYFFS